MKNKRHYLISVLILFFLVGCSNNGCAMQPSVSRIGDVDLNANEVLKVQRKKKFLKYIAARTVRIIIQCQVLNTKTNKITKPYKSKGWGTGTILVSTDNYSYIQTAAHVVTNSEKINGDLKETCDKYLLERRGLDNKVIKVYGKVAIYKKDTKQDIAVLIVPYSLNVSSKFAKTSYIGQRVHLLGYPSLRGVSGTHLSYASGYIMTLNMGKQKNWKSSKGIARSSAVGYFGNSGGAIWTNSGKIVGMVTSLVGFRTFGGFIPQHGSLYGLDLKHIKEFYKVKQVDLN